MRKNNFHNFVVSTTIILLFFISGLLWGRTIKQSEAQTYDCIQFRIDSMQGASADLNCSGGGFSGSGPAVQTSPKQGEYNRKTWWSRLCVHP